MSCLSSSVAYTGQHSSILSLHFCMTFLLCPCLCVLSFFSSFKGTGLAIEFTLSCHTPYSLSENLTGIVRESKEHQHMYRKAVVRQATIEWCGPTGKQPGTSVCLLCTSLQEAFPSLGRQPLYMSGLRPWEKNAAVTSFCTHSSILCKQLYLDQRMPLAFQD